MGVIEDFVGEYERQFDFWDASARTARGLLEAELASSGLRAIVTSRAKSVDRLREKLHRRNLDAQYPSVAAIRDDIADLAGVRVALYFPGQMDEAEQIIRATLDVRHKKGFPSAKPVDLKATAPRPVTGDSTVQSSVPVVERPQRFSGYGARHFRVHIPVSRLSAEQERYASALVEIQVASVLMHAWSEVEHDLVYKPLEGELSPSEYALLDQLNGLVLAGEIALEQLQMAGDQRVAAAKTPFRDHYELAEFLRTHLATLGIDLTDATLGRVDVLFNFLADESSATASAIEPYLDLLEQDFEHRPVAEQLADLMLSGNKSRYDAYSRAMSASRHPSALRRSSVAGPKGNSLETLALGEFVASWVLLETVLKDLYRTDGARLPPLTVLFRRLGDEELISQEQYAELDMMRELRNRVFHGRAGGVPPEHLREAAAWLRNLAETIRRTAGES
ncbi:hypothetical protein RF644_18110 [Kocuria sp. CPCC 205258]|uniref:GTP pyrophosphokinase family protein n=1 Tax=Kocuria sp. CPCC 205258 TaxID=3073552 RepID=UPI0034D747C8